MPAFRAFGSPGQALRGAGTPAFRGGCSAALRPLASIGGGTDAMGMDVGGASRVVPRELLVAPACSEVGAAAGADGEHERPPASVLPYAAPVGRFGAGSAVLDRDAEVFERLVAGALDHDSGGPELLQGLDDRGREPVPPGGDRGPP